MFYGTYEYKIKKRFGYKTGTLAIDVDQQAQTLVGKINLKGHTIDLRGKVDGHRIEFYGSRVTKHTTYYFNVGGYSQDDGKTFAGKMEHKGCREGKDFYATRIED